MVKLQPRRLPLLPPLQAIGEQDCQPDEQAHSGRQLGQHRRQRADDDLSVDFATVAAPGARVAVVVTAPLTTNETWTQMTPGELRVFVDGVSAG